MERGELQPGYVFDSSSYTASGHVFQVSDSLLQLVLAAFGLKIEKRISSKLLKFRL